MFKYLNASSCVDCVWVFFSDKVDWHPLMLLLNIELVITAHFVTLSLGHALLPLLLKVTIELMELYAPMYLTLKF